MCQGISSIKGLYTATYSHSNPSDIKDLLLASGSLMKDNKLRNGKVFHAQQWSFDELEQYKSMLYFKKAVLEAKYKLPFNCSTGSAVMYDMHLYCVEYDTNILVKYQISSVLVKSVLANALVQPQALYDYMTGSHQQIDFAADETGLYLIYVTSSSKGNIVVSKIDPRDLSVLTTWITTYKKNKAGHAFLICGILYTTNGASGKSIDINYAYGTNKGLGKAVSVPMNTAVINDIVYFMDYNAVDNALYVWGHADLRTYHSNRLMMYPVVLKNE